MKLTSMLAHRSGTHECRPKALLQPESLEELESLVADYHKRGEAPQKLRNVPRAHPLCRLCYPLHMCYVIVSR